MRPEASLLVIQELFYVVGTLKAIAVTKEKERISMLDDARKRVNVSVLLTAILLSIATAAAPIYGTAATFEIHHLEHFNPTRIAVDGTGNIWMVGANGRMFARVGQHQSLQTFSLPEADTQIQDITRGQDGNIWFVTTQSRDGSRNFVGEILSDGSVKAQPINRDGAYLKGLTLARDGNIWFTEFGAGRVGRITSAGKIREFTLPESGAAPSTITSSPDGSVWTTGRHKIFRLLPNGAVQAYDPHLRNPLRSIASSGNELFWVTAYGTSTLLRVTLSGRTTAYPQLDHHFGVSAIAAGKAMAIAYDLDNESIARIDDAGIILDLYHLGPKYPASALLDLESRGVYFVSSAGDAYGCIRL
jgi:virginiamycin B lyase